MVVKAAKWLEQLLQHWVGYSNKNMPEKQEFTVSKNKRLDEIFIISPSSIWQQEKKLIYFLYSMLEERETTKGNFFKNEPEWVDFENGFIVERREVDEIAINWIPIKFNLY